jgi:hypothetical protein
MRVAWPNYLKIEPVAMPGLLVKEARTETASSNAVVKPVIDIRSSPRIETGATNANIRPNCNRLGSTALNLLRSYRPMGCQFRRIKETVLSIAMQ